MTVPLSPSPARQPQAPAASGPEVRGDAPFGCSAAGSVNSTDILRGEKTVAIHHNGLTYRLQATRLGKLILTK